MLGFEKSSRLGSLARRSLGAWCVRWPVDVRSVDGEDGRCYILLVKLSDEPSPG